MALILTEEERADLVRRCREEAGVRRWRRYRAILLVADGWQVEKIAQALECCPNSIWNWVAAWRREGLRGITEAPHAGRVRALDAAGERRVNALLASAPQDHGWQTTGWTVPLLQTELAQQGDAVSAQTVRRTLHRLGWRWKRPKYLLGRPDPAYTEKKGPSPRGWPPS